MGKFSFSRLARLYQYISNLRKVGSATALKYRQAQSNNKADEGHTNSIRNPWVQRPAKAKVSSGTHNHMDCCAHARRNQRARRRHYYVQKDVNTTGKNDKKNQFSDRKIWSKPRSRTYKSASCLSMTTSCGYGISTWLSTYLHILIPNLPKDRKNVREFAHGENRNQ